MKRIIMSGLAIVLSCGIMITRHVPASAANIIDDWKGVKVPSPPALTPVTVNAKTTALLLLDFLPSFYCSDDPRCASRTSRSHAS